jgi:hypothetical protein
VLQQVSTAVNAGNNDIASDLSDAERDKVLPASRTASPRLQHIQLEPRQALSPCLCCTACPSFYSL